MYQVESNEKVNPHFLFPLIHNSVGVCMPESECECMCQCALMSVTV